MRLCLISSLCLATSLPALAQKDMRVLPLPIESPRILDPGTIVPLTAEEKVKLALRNSFGPRAFANRLLLAGINQWQDHPEEWGQGWDGYGKRFASRMGRLVARNAVQTSVDVALGTDPRYDRCDCAGFKSRIGHAWRRVLIARKDNGGEMIGVSRLAGAYVTPMITDQWYPDRLNTWSHKLESGTWFLGWRGVNNTIKEFWPEIKRTVFRRGS